jgi:AcrR family transcriptional regulator
MRVNRPKDEEFDSSLRAQDAPDHIHPQIKRTREKILSATHRLMFEGGIGGVTIDAVARRTKIAKTTIYRHWPSREALVLDACSRLASRAFTPDTGSLEGDFRVLATRLAMQLKSARWPAILPSMIDAAERDPKFAKFQTQLQAGFNDAYRAAIARAKARGEDIGDCDTALVIASIMGPLFFRRWFSREPIDDAVVEGVVQGAIAGLKRPAK